MAVAVKNQTFNFSTAIGLELPFHVPNRLALIIMINTNKIKNKKKYPVKIYHTKMHQQKENLNF